ncbi:hypothetical protein D3C71_2091830 [compost metagenome]
MLRHKTDAAGTFNRPLLQRQGAEQQLHQGTFAAPVGAQYRQDFATRQLQAQRVKQRRLAGPTKTEIFNRQ